MLQFSLDCPFLIALYFFSLSFIHESTNVAFESTNMYFTIDNPDKIATLGTQERERRKTKQNSQHRTTAKCWTSLYAKINK
jgi:hypothetical protein